MNIQQPQQKPQVQSFSILKDLKDIRVKLAQNGLKKDGKVNSGPYSYNYFKFDSLAKVIFPLLEEKGITVDFSTAPQAQTTANTPEKGVHVSYMMVMRLMKVKDESKQPEVYESYQVAYGTHISDMGKANGCASTYAKRLLLMNTFAIIEEDKQG